MAGEIKKVAAEHPPVVAIPEVVGVAVVAVQPQAVLVVFDVEDLEVAIGVRFVRDAARKPLSFDYSRNCILFWAISPLAPRTKYLYFLEYSFIVYGKYCRNKFNTPLFQTVVRNTPDKRILGSVAESRNRPHIHLLP